MEKKCRRVVTGFNKQGDSVVISESFVNNQMEKNSRPGVSLNNIWHTKVFPNNNSADIDEVDQEFTMFPKSFETICRISSFEPEKSHAKDDFDSDAYFSDLDASDTLVQSKRHPFMHKSKSLDYAIILEGEITLILDNEEVHLSQGDIVIQRGTSHAWVNNSDKLARVCFILMGAQ